MVSVKAVSYRHLLIGGGGALYYFKFMKPKQAVKGGTDLDDFDFDEYDEDERSEQEGEEE